MSVSTRGMLTYCLIYRTIIDYHNRLPFFPYPHPHPHNTHRNDDTTQWSTPAARTLTATTLTAPGPREAKENRCRQRRPPSNHSHKNGNRSHKNGSHQTESRTGD